MTGFAAFQPNAVQQNAFQSGHSLVAADYSLAALDFAEPVLVKVLAAGSYSLGGLGFSTPAVHEIQSLAVDDYSLGTLDIGTNFLRQTHHLGAGNYALASLAFATSALTQTHRLTTNAMALSPLAFARPTYSLVHPLSVGDYELSALDISTTAFVTIIGQALTASDYTLDQPRFYFPRLTEVEAVTALEAFYSTEMDEAVALLNGLLDDLVQSVSDYTVRHRAVLLRAEAEEVLVAGELGTRLRECFDAVYDARAVVERLDVVRQHLLEQEPRSLAAIAVVFNGITLTLATVSRLITQTSYVSQEDVEVVLDWLVPAFDFAKQAASDAKDSGSYQAINALGGAITNHLAQTELKLPRRVKFQSPLPMPALWVANRVYADASRFNEIIAENKIVHPAFCLTSLNVLSE